MLTSDGASLGFHKLLDKIREAGEVRAGGGGGRPLGTLHPWPLTPRLGIRVGPAGPTPGCRRLPAYTLEADPAGPEATS